MPSQRVAQDLQSFLSLTMGQLTATFRSAYLQSTLQMWQSIVGAFTCSGHAHLSMRDELGEQQSSSLNNGLGLLGSPYLLRFQSRLPGP
jgi:hypothetical protein